MTIRPVLLYPDARLRQVSEPVDDFESEEFETLVSDMRETMQAHRAHGLAAIQVGVPKRVFITQLSDGGTRVYVNPVIEEQEGEVIGREGCLSFPSVIENIPRFEDVSVRAYDEHGREFSCSLDEVDAVAFQHEYDHLDGKLFLDYVSNMKKRFMLKKLKKYKRKLGL